MAEKNKMLPYRGQSIEYDKQGYKAWPAGIVVRGETRVEVEREIDKVLNDLPVEKREMKKISHLL